MFCLIVILFQRKARLEMNADKSDKDDSGNEDDNLENFMTIDSVGDVDGEFLLSKCLESTVFEVMLINTNCQKL